MAQYQVLYWRHVPAQVKVFPEKGRPVSKVMPARFQEEIDRIAMREGLSGSDEYLAQWRWTRKQERPGSPDEVLDEVLRELETNYDSAR